MSECYKDGGTFIRLPTIGEAKVSFSSGDGILSAIFSSEAIKSGKLAEGNIAYSFQRQSSLTHFERGGARDSDERKLQVIAIHDEGNGRTAVIVGPEGWKPRFSFPGK